MRFHTGSGERLRQSGSLREKLNRAVWHLILGLARRAPPAAAGDGSTIAWGAPGCTAPPATCCAESGGGRGGWEDDRRMPGGAAAPPPSALGGVGGGTRSRSDSSDAACSAGSGWCVGSSRKVMVHVAAPVASTPVSIATSLAVCGISSDGSHGESRPAITAAGSPTEAQYRLRNMTRHTHLTRHRYQYSTSRFSA